MRATGIALALCLAQVAEAQPTRVEVESALTRMLVGEAGWTRERDHRAILFAVHRLDAQDARSSHMLETLHLHIQWWKHGAPKGRPWVAGIDTRCEEPAGFPSHLSWDNHRRRCFQVVRRVRDYYAGRLVDPCKGKPNNWRARGKPSHRAKRLYYQVGCGRASRHNWFDTTRLPTGRPNRKAQKHRRAAARDRLGRS